VPEGVHWFNFLVRMGWQDKRTLGDQPSDWVHQNWEIYRYQLVTGMFNRML